MPSRRMQCAMMEQGDNSAQAPPEYQGHHWCPPTNIMSRDSGLGAAHKRAVPRTQQGMPQCNACMNGHHQCRAQLIACDDHARTTTLPHRVKAPMMHTHASSAMGTPAKYRGSDAVLPQWQQQAAMMRCDGDTMVTICQCKSAQCQDQCTCTNRQQQR